MLFRSHQRVADENRINRLIQSANNISSSSRFPPFSKVSYQRTQASSAYRSPKYYNDKTLSLKLTLSYIKSRKYNQQSSIRPTTTISSHLLRHRRRYIFVQNAHVATVETPEPSPLLLDTKKFPEPLLVLRCTSRLVRFLDMNDSDFAHRMVYEIDTDARKYIVHLPLICSLIDS